MTLLSVAGTDFCAFGSFKQRLDNRGLVWLGGDNRDTKAAVSNGASKTSFFKAISWGLFGETIDGVDGDAVIREGTKRAEVVIELKDSAGQRFRTVRTRRKGAPRVELYADESLEPIPGSKDEIQSQINRLVGMDFHTFRNVVLYGQSDSQRFIAKNTSDAERKAVLQAILRTQIYSAAHIWIKARLTELKSKIDAQRSKMENAEGRLEENDLDALQIESTAWIAKRDEDVKQAKVKAAEAIAEAKRLAAEMPNTGAMERELEALQKAAEGVLELRRSIDALDCVFDTSGGELEEATTEASSFKHTIRRADEDLEQLAGGNCPLCTTPMSGKHAKAHLESLKETRSGAVVAHDALKLKLEKLIGDRKQNRSQRSELREKEMKFRRIDGEIAAKREQIALAKGTKALAAAALKRAQEILATAKATAELENPHLKHIELAKERRKTLRNEIFLAKSELKSLEDDRRHYDFWNRGFGPSGLPSFVLDSVMPYLTERTNFYLETLSDGDITMNFTTQTELKSSKGEIRDRIGIEWEAEGTAMKPLSGGQFKKCEIATTLAMMDLVATREGAATDLLLLDEALDGVDEEGYSRIIALLHKLRTSRKSIFVVSHSGEIGEIFERGILVVKENGVARLEKVA